MKKPFLFSAIFILFLSVSSLTFAVQGDDILGFWVTEGGGSRVEIFKKENRYFAKIIALKEPYYLPGEVEGMEGKPRLDLNNSKKSLRSRPLIGLELMKDFRFDNDKWEDGKIYDPENGKTYKCKMSLAKDGTLRVRGYIGVSLLGRTTVWEPASAYLKRELVFLGFTNYSCIEKCINDE